MPHIIFLLVITGAGEETLLKTSSRVREFSFPEATVNFLPLIGFGAVAASIVNQSLTVEERHAVNGLADARHRPISGGGVGLIPPEAYG